MKGEETTASRAPDNKISLDAAAVAVLLEPDGIFTLKEEQRAPLEASHSGKVVFALLPTVFGESFVKHECD